MEAWCAVEDAQSELPLWGYELSADLPCRKSRRAPMRVAQPTQKDWAPRFSSGKAGCGRDGALGPLQLRGFREPYHEDLSGGVTTIPLREKGRKCQ